MESDCKAPHGVFFDSNHSTQKIPSTAADPAVAHQLQRRTKRTKRRSTMTTATARLLLLVCTVAATLTCSWAFGMVGRTSVALSRTPQTTRVVTQSPLLPALRPSPLFFKTNDNDPATAEDEEDDDDDEVEAKGGILKILFISVPLFCKFCIVLVVKFLTDLVVYPLLWLYRLAHLTKNRVLKLFGVDTTKKSASSKGR